MAVTPDNVYSSLLVIPGDVRSRLLPEADLTPPELIAFALPSSTSSIVFPDFSASFTAAAPTENPQVLQTRPSLGAKALDAAHTALHTAIAAGRPVRSFSDPRFKQSRLPVWSLTYMRQAAFAKEKQSLFSSRRKWVESHSNLRGGPAALAAFDTLPWGGHLSAYTVRSMPISDLLAFLGGDEFARGAWMSDETMDLGIGIINERLPPALKNKVTVAPATFWATINKKRPDYERRFLDQYRDLADSGQCEQLLFPAIIGPSPLNEDEDDILNHWILVRLDFKKNIISFGEFPCMGSSTAHLLNHTVANTDPSGTLYPHEALKRLQRWCRHAWPKRAFVIEMKDMPVVRQTDWSACGIFVLALLRHLLLGEPLPPSGKAYEQRLRYFRELVEVYNRAVRVPHDLQYILRF
jgi:hypothetical protein